MLVACAAVSLIAPISASASDFDIEGMNSYKRSKPSSKSKKRFDSKSFTNKLATSEKDVEAQQSFKSIEAGMFSTTTAMDGKVIGWIGGIEGVDQIDTDEDGSLADEATEAVQGGYTATMNLNTSFTGDDNLYIRLKGGETGNAWKGKPATYHISTKDTGDSFNVDKIWYTFPIGDQITAYAGPRIENYYMYITPSIYKPGALKAFKLGGNSNFGASTDGGFGLKWEHPSGWGIASNVVDKDGDGQGFFQKTSTNKWDTQVAYTQPNYHLSLTLSDAQRWSSQSYNATALGENTAEDSTGWAARGYWIPESSAIPEVTVGYDWKHFEKGAIGSVKKATSYMFGLTWKDIIQADDKIGFAFTKPLAAVSLVGGGDTGEVNGPYLWELYYSFKQNDSMTITPAVFAGKDVWQEEDNIFGVVVTSALKF